MHARFKPNQSRGGRNTPQSSRSQTVTRSVPEPQKIMCDICEHSKSRAAFSRTKLDYLQKRLQRDPSLDPEVARIISCARHNNPKVEAKCENCGWTKGKNEFNKTQWTNTSKEDGGECLECQLRDQYEPGEHDSDIENDPRRTDSDESDE
ncbi:hypothetical protein CBER1_02869 [Cercospora berteroae]|uniref:Stc1 domain-containing protein n=1 Tax=Cercospora berteroae TaxID=357750 RepID=A0A2S6BQJ7_9PEZI|nr:hypothetical protein CBER1_02869 [Cercospora berteroae]